MTVAFFLTGPFPVPSETFILNQITGLLDRGHEVHIHARQPDEPSPVHSAVDEYRLLDRTSYWPSLPRRRALRAARGFGFLVRNPAALPAMLRSLDWTRYRGAASSLNLLYWAARLAPRRSYDIVYCHFGWNGLYASMLQDIGLLEGRLVTVFHGADLSWQLEASGNQVYRPLFRIGDLFLPISEHWRNRLIELGAPVERTVVHRMGIDCDRFALLERRLDPRRPVELITISRLVEKKGVEYGIQAVARLVEHGRNVRYTVIGDGPLRDPLMRLIQQLGLRDRVTLLGWQDQDVVQRLLHQSHLALAPSVTGQDGDQEGIPVSLMEAMATGLPVVSTWHSGIPELVQHDVSGHLVPERDADGLAQALEHLIDHPERWSAMGRAGRRQVMDHFNIQGLNDRLVHLFRELLREERRSPQPARPEPRASSPPRLQ